MIFIPVVLREIKQWGGKITCPIDTIYFGGGTPSLLEHRLTYVMNAVRENFNVSENSEITLEINPSGDSKRILEFAKKAGINRLSIGIQSGDDEELKILGRTHNFREAENTFKMARELGFCNISADLMIGLPFSAQNEKLEESLDKIIGLNPEHISAYILKIEPKTAFYKDMDSLCLPDDEDVSKQYLFMSRYLNEKGYSHYEISNFAKEGFESRHNVKYWTLADYLGLGPSAHSFINGKRFYYPNDIKAFISGNDVINDGDGGDLEEFIMLSLRLKRGLNTEELYKKYNFKLSDKFYKKCETFEKAGFMSLENNNFCLTDEGMLLSNSIISELLEEIGE